MFLLLEHFVLKVQNLGLGIPRWVWEKFRDKIEILSTHNLCSEICNSLSENCNFLPHQLFFTHDATDVLGIQSTDCPTYNGVTSGIASCNCLELVCV